MSFNAADVKAVMAPGRDYDLSRNPDLSIVIRRANAFVARVVTCATDKGITLTQEEQDLIGMYIAAHGYVISDQTYQSKSTSSASASFQGKTGMYLESSRYGQAAIEIDPSGCVKALGMGVRAGGFWGGTRQSDQLTYDERN